MEHSFFADPLQSFVEVSFWHTLYSKKLTEIGLSMDVIPIHGTIFPGKQNLPCRIIINSDSFNNNVSSNGFMYPGKSSCFVVSGSLLIINTIEEFKNIDKSQLINSSGSTLWNQLSSPNPILNTFNLLVFADLKKYKFYYWFGFPAFNVPSIQMNPQKLTIDIQTSLILSTYCNSLKDLFFFYNEETQTCHSMDSIDIVDGFVLCMIDPSSRNDCPSWLLRNVIVWINKKFNVLSIRVYCLRDDLWNNGHTISLKLDITLSNNITEIPLIVGWELNPNGKYGPKSQDLSSLMDPIKIMPDLDIDSIQKKSCLLLGAGTLGCYVARGLIAWGISNITFIDNGTVSYSNPVRQPLFTHQNAVESENKAIAASNALKLIHPTIQSKGIGFSIPMPGHFIDNDINVSIKKLEQLVIDHDVIFLLMDSRESRWLPTLFGSLYKKIVINVALGFDTFLVMRHGVDNQLGCYYCNDIVAPTNSLKDRTLDQQCTVTRPGLSAIASGLAVELLSSILTHPEGIRAPADTSHDPSFKIPSKRLGLVPHQIRGFLSHFSHLIVSGSRYERCIACSDFVLDSYKKQGVDFIVKVLGDPEALERICGITHMIEQIKEEDCEWIEDE